MLFHRFLRSGKIGDGVLNRLRWIDVVMLYRATAVMVMLDRGFVETMLWSLHAFPFRQTLTLGRCVPFVNGSGATECLLPGFRMAPFPLLSTYKRDGLLLSD